MTASLPVPTLVTKGGLLLVFTHVIKKHHSERRASRDNPKLGKVSQREERGNKKF